MAVVMNENEGTAGWLVVDELLPAAVMTRQTRVSSATKRRYVFIALLQLILYSRHLLHVHNVCVAACGGRLKTEKSQFKASSPHNHQCHFLLQLSTP